MTTRDLTTDELTRFGVTLEDEGPHAFDPAVEWWNESWFWDWFDAAGTRAGHCRIGLHPNQGRAWIWFYSYADGEWIALEEPRLPLSALKLPELAYDGWGLRFSWEASHPLRLGRFRFEGFGRVLSGPRTGMILPLGADLDVRAAGPPHSPGRANAPGHSSSSYPASRFEQPIEVSGRLRAGGEWQDFAGRGERDHSWGPRAWNLEWTFLAVSASDVRLQCAEARIPDVGRFPGGYLQRGETQTVREVTFDVSLDEA
ncbi:MAG: hypothetical protein L0Y66_25385, partial [Myxococcaceae bacterium]|nr:hypothetical protein [Myxococcaceae bacterium]